MIVLEGMPGAGKTTAANALATGGDRVVGEYTTADGQTIPVAENPRVEDDDAHQNNWLLKHRQADEARRAGTVYCDRDWLSAVAFAASIDDTGQLLAARTGWAIEQLEAGRLAVADHYLVLLIDPVTSLSRRAGRLPVGHPWNRRESLQRLRQFYADPIGAVDVSLGRELSRAQWHQLHRPRCEQVLGYLHHLADEG